MLQHLLTTLKDLPPELTTMIVSSLPIAELRGGIPVAFALGLTPLYAYLIAIAGNLIPVLPLLILLQPVSNILRKLPVMDRFFTWLFERTQRKAGLIEKYEAIGLALFVAIPLPITGMWTGVVAASLFKIRIRYALPAIIVGVMIAGVIVTALCMAGVMVYNGVSAV